MIYMFHGFPVWSRYISLSGGEWLLALRTVVLSAGFRQVSARKNSRQGLQNLFFFTLALHLPHFFSATPDTSPSVMCSEIARKAFFIARTAVSRLQDCPQCW